MAGGSPRVYCVCFCARFSVFGPAILSLALRAVALRRPSSWAESDFGHPSKGRFARSGEFGQDVPDRPCELSVAGDALLPGVPPVSGDALVVRCRCPATPLCACLSTRCGWLSSDQGPFPFRTHSDHSPFSSCNCIRRRGNGRGKPTRFRAVIPRTSL